MSSELVHILLVLTATSAMMFRTLVNFILLTRDSDSGNHSTFDPIFGEGLHQFGILTKCFITPWWIEDKPTALGYVSNILSVMIYLSLIAGMVAMVV